MILMMIFIIRLKIYKMYVIIFYKNHLIIIIQLYNINLKNTNKMS
jgi:hypothetical protein